MRCLLAASFVLALTLALPSRAHAEGDFGLGLMLGVPTGLSMKYYLGDGGSSPVALQAGIGAVERFGEDSVQIHLDVVWHPAILARGRNFALPLYVGVGGRVVDDDDDYCLVNGNRVYCYDDDTHVGVRVPFGLLLDFARPQIDVFFELAMFVDFLEIDDGDGDGYYDDDDRVGLNGALGARFYF